MTDNIKWSVVLACPGEEELALLAELSSRPDTRVVGMVDPDGSSLGAGLAEILGVRLYPDLASLPAGQAVHLIHPPVNDQVAPLVDEAARFGLEPITARGFNGLLLKSVLARHPGPRLERPRVNHEYLEMETTAIHRTLSRMEEALDREALLRWLLGLATRATGAGSGSIMLFDEAAAELYVAFAYGLSETTLHRTRVRLGEGIAGRVAATGKTELVTDNRHPGGRRDRSAISSAICAPLTWEGRLVGVLNLSTVEGEGELADNTVELVESLTHRFGLILHRFLRMQSVHEGERFRRMEEEFTRDTGQPENLSSTLIYWAEDLANLAEADAVELGLLTSDGDLLVADSEEIRYLSPPSPLHEEVLTSGNPVVTRPDPAGPSGEHPEPTVFLLPVGRGPCRALISVTFFSPARAHRFHTLSSEVLYLVNRHLANLLDRAAAADQMDRLSTLTAALSDLALGGSGAPGADRERVLAAVCHLTGGRRACLLTGQNTAQGCAIGPDEERLLAEAHRLLEQALQRGWSSSIWTSEGNGEQDPHRRSLLVVPVRPGTPYPGLLVLDKVRLHPLDGASFTEFDALFARRLAPLLGRETPFLTADLADSLAEQALSALEPRAVRPEPASIPPLPPSDLEPHLRAEMDRCDRYHTRLGLVAFRLTPPTGPAPEVDKVLASLAFKLRSSDRVGALPDGTLLIIVPEDIQSLPALQKRVTGLLQGITGQPDLVVTTAARIYPGSEDTSAGLIRSVVKAMA